MFTDPTCLSGVELRYVLTALIWSEPRTWTTAELADRLVEAGFDVGGRPSKVVADALRWEQGRGRVVRTGRGRYVAGSVPGATMRRIRRRADERWRRVRMTSELEARPGGRFT